MTRVVADTNVLISALVFGGLPQTFLDLAMNHSFDLVTSSVLLDELDGKLLGKFAIDVNTVKAIRARLLIGALLVDPRIYLSVVKEDPDDDRVLECAVAGTANLVVTGDRHLLKMRNFESIDIVRVREFLELFASTL